MGSPRPSPQWHLEGRGKSQGLGVRVPEGRDRSGDQGAADKKPGCSGESMALRLGRDHGGEWRRGGKRSGEENEQRAGDDSNLF